MTDFQILAVCTANICRSPAFAAMLNAGLDGCEGLATHGVTVRSAGLHALDGVSTDPAMIDAVHEIGVEVESRPAQQLTHRHVVESSLILTATRQQRSEIARLDVLARDRCFTIREFARYCAVAELTAANLVEDQLANLIDVAVGRRGSLHPRRAEDDDVQDPYGHRRRTYRAVTSTMVDSAAAILGAAGQRERTSRR